MWGKRLLGCVFVLALGSACGGAGHPAEAPATRSDQCPESSDGLCGSPDAHEDRAPSPAPEATEPADTKPADAKGPEATAPSFKENGSVLEAINAVPQGTPRLNVEQEALGQPLGNVELYEPCKPAAKAHFKAKVAVWDGKAVGLDLTTTPKNQKFADCIAERIRSVTWQDKVKSLNVVEYTF